ncbi:Fe-S oxidoreductase [Anaerocolumna cellulosilytica]|uniref:Fe-S oxidoreductase n=1 Tax=Anaerocolumna cellulosilytica TaxID=433286 RepID=A0A6S6R351_9FIRM|nr:epoxyqueuosine reductase [Anaerocolumna cellulosilytica]MBB5196693.1 epoxyqueuosine reductase [Anaerocolumna cellulosilytica]BCJ93955.1 Fe-S oxidoreductase [Anaerocolumna cellulosilytica]
MLSIEKSIQAKAYALGYEKCGIVPIHKLDGYEEKLKERIEKVPESERFYQGQKRLLNLNNTYPWAKSAVVLALSYNKYKVPEQVKGHIAKSYLFDVRIDKNSVEYNNRQKFEQYLGKLGIKAENNKKFGIVGMRWAALQAGLGVVRRNNFFYTESGSWNHIEAWLIDKDIELLEEKSLAPCPAGCSKCIGSCPTKSLSEAYTMSPTKCISYLTTFGGRELYQEPLAGKFGDCIYGCDICQDVCPMNAKEWKGREEFPGLSEIIPNLSPENIMSMRQEYYTAKIQPKFFYLTDKELWKWQVNTLNYMDNQYKDEYRKYILKACESEYTQVRNMALIIIKNRLLAV